MLQLERLTRQWRSQPGRCGEGATASGDERPTAARAQSRCEHFVRGLVPRCVLGRVGSASRTFRSASIFSPLRAGAIAGAGAVREAWRSESAARLPRSPLGDLARVYPQIDLAEIGSPLEVTPENMTAFALVADGRLYALGEVGTLQILDANPEKHSVADKTDLFYARSTWSLPVLSRGLLYVSQHERDMINGTGPRLICYDFRGE